MTNSNITFSVIIPTFNRPEQLRQTLESILFQSKLPVEILVIDQSNGNETEMVCKQLESSCEEKRIDLQYHKIVKPSLTFARNFGMRLAKGDFISFFDDDVCLEFEYFEELARGISRNNAVVVQGKITNYFSNWSFLQGLYRRLFLLTSYTKSSGSVYSTFGNCLPVRFENDIPCAWASGCNHTIRADIAKNFEYDESLVSYALGEDVDMTYRIGKAYPNQVWAIVKARLSHLEAKNARISNETLTFMEAVHRRYLFYKNIEQTKLNIALFYWSRLGTVLLGIISLVKFWNDIQGKSKRVIHIFRAEKYAWSHRGKIKNLTLEFFHDWFFRRTKLR